MNMVEIAVEFFDWSVSCHKYDAFDRLEASWIYRRTDTDNWDKTQMGCRLRGSCSPRWNGYLAGLGVMAFG